jgi:hypothetical protein
VHARIFSRLAALVTGADIGRVLVASLHQAIADELQTRVDFYDHWLGGQRMRDGSVGLAPMTAVLGFLRAEGEPYHKVMERAGLYAADWTVDSLSAARRRLIQALPRPLRLRVALRMAAETIRAGYAPTKAKVRIRRNQARFEVRNSLFCRVRAPQGAALCDFHAALIVQMLHRFDLPSTVSIEQCTGTQGPLCAAVIEIGRPA